MKKPALIIYLCLYTSFSFAQKDSLKINGRAVSSRSEISREQRNKQIATNFYQDLWFTNNTEKYTQYVADTYVAHDIGDRKNVTEPAIEQKITADRFWENGSWNSKINYQIAEGDLVATRWEATYIPETLLGKIMYGAGTIPIINVFRFNEEGKIVEIWNHRHDIDSNMTLKFTIKGFLFGLLIALIPTLIAIRLRRKLKKVRAWQISDN
jgi:predicted SnoaL-like aldol condensation-catalyzing enzyme